ncbi:hypothetical protein L228DRAFT_284646 [Xylona heveae TC161]|uniref:Uncharacterized protein n=1 Tax=Xylona heveae (strain CBS 132557 / TC161) TaxID=1328760 RepID=A0A165F8J7_XYLHT|nr:hypothetical protein L228DRAFT_284646 [Xylona heveae TC161]KZF20701.1 hypothetical protein L228DRAFT_284646 [Xylona heveae TC161]
MSSFGLLAQSEASGRIRLVAMDDVQFAAFSQQLSAIGTRDLAGCSVVAITSPYGAILAHIPPVPYATQDPYAGDRHVQEMMIRVQSLYTQHRSYFPAANTFVVCAVYEGEVALPDQKRIIETHVQQMGLTFRPVHYVTPRNPLNPGHGTVLVDAVNVSGQMPAVYIEDRPVPDHQQPSEWVWDEAYRRFRRYVNGQWEWAS